MSVGTDDGIRTIVTRLARPRTGGGHTIERAAILATGSDSAAIEAWILGHTGEAERVSAPVASGGLHTRRLDAAPTSPRRYLLPGGVLDIAAISDATADHARSTT